MDYLASADLVFLAWVLTFLAYLITVSDRIGVPVVVIDILTGLVETFQNRMTVISSGNAGHADVVAKDEARAALETNLREIIRIWIRRNDKVTNDDLAKFKLSVWKTGRTKKTRPKKRPGVKIEHKQYGEIEVITGPMPDGVDHLEIWYENIEDWIMAEKDYTKMSHMFISSTTHTTLYLTQGETYIIVCRWAVKSSKTRKGPWSSPKIETIS